MNNTNPLCLKCNSWVSRSGKMLPNNRADRLDRSPADSPTQRSLSYYTPLMSDSSSVLADFLVDRKSVV